jgi:hypothetical protein
MFSLPKKISFDPYWTLVEDLLEGEFGPDNVNRAKMDPCPLIFGQGQIMGQVKSMLTLRSFQPLFRTLGQCQLWRQNGHRRLTNEMRFLLKVIVKKKRGLDSDGGNNG